MNKSFRSEAQPLPTTPAINESKQYLHTMIAAVMVPFWQATITAIMIFIGVGLLDWLVFDLVDPIKPAVFLAVLGWLTVWGLRMWQWFIMVAERATGLDLNHDHKIADKPINVVRIDKVHDNSHFESFRIPFPASDEQMELFADGMINQGKWISRRQWTPKLANGFSEEEWTPFCDMLLKHELTEKRDNKLYLNADGVDTFKTYLPSPTPTMNQTKTP